MLQDIQYALRQFARNPGFSFVAILALALGIGANSAIFSYINAVLLQPLPYPEEERLVAVAGRFDPELFSKQFPGREYVDRDQVLPARMIDRIREQSNAFEMMAAYHRLPGTLTGGAEPETVVTAHVSPEFFQLLGARAELGRTFLAGESGAADEHSVILSYGLWKNRFGSDREIVGRTVVLNEEPRTVVGVLHETPVLLPFMPEAPSLWIPLTPEHSVEGRKRPTTAAVIARLKPEIGLEGAREQLNALAPTFFEEFPMKMNLRARRLEEAVTNDVRPALLVLLAAVACVLLIACANVANLLLARATFRQQEISIRTVLGAGRGRLLRQMLTESTLLAVAGGVVGLMLAFLVSGLLVKLSPFDLPRLASVRVDGWVVAFTFGLSLLTGVLFGGIPALLAVRRNLNSTLKEAESRTMGSTRRSRISSLLIVSEVALSLILMIGAALFIRSFQKLMAVDPGIRTENVVTAGISLPQSRYRESPRRTAFVEELVERVNRIPGVHSAAVVNSLPLSPLILMNASFSIPGQTLPPNSIIGLRVATAAYFRTLQVPLLKGRYFTDSEEAAKARVVLINEEAARRYWPNEDPVGRHMRIVKEDGLEIVGVVANVKYGALDSVSQPEAYMPYGMFPGYHLALVARSESDGAQLAPVLRKLVAEIDKDQPVLNVLTMKQILLRTVQRPRFYMILLASFAGLAILLATVGIYGVLSYSVSRKTREIGIRMALGAKKSDIFRLIIREGMVLAIIGIAVGAAGAVAATRLLRGMLFSIEPTDPGVFCGVSALLLLTALAACLIPAYRGMKMEPLNALRYE